MKKILSKLNKISALLIITLVSVFAVSALPAIPNSFYGDVTVSDAPAADGTPVTAEIDGVEYISSTTISGTYGTYSAFRVPGDDSETPSVKEGGVDGDTILFYVGGELAGQSTFASGSSTNLDLLVEGACEPSTEVCDGLDNDCDSEVDEGFDVGGDCSDGLGECETPGILQCDGVGGVECVLVPSVYVPIDEICDGLDNDCDGSTDEDFPTLGDVCSVGVGACEASGNFVCNGAEDGVECSATPGNPVEEVCNNGEDDDCDGSVDEGCDCVVHGDCDDDNVCTDDVCNAGVCEYTNNEASCDDGLFCTVNDVCSEGACVSGGDRDCSGSNVFGIDTCDYIPDDNPFTRDFRTAIPSTCDYDADICTLGNTDISHTCDKTCDEAACEDDEDCDGASVCLEDCTCSVVPEYCIEIQDMRILDNAQQETTEISQGEFYYVEVTNKNVCEEPVDTMLIVQALDSVSTPMNIGTAALTLDADETIVFTVGFTMDAEAELGDYTAEAFNWDQWCSMEGGCTPLSLDASLGFSVVK